jgi:hypothetical protein
MIAGCECPHLHRCYPASQGCGVLQQVLVRVFSWSSLVLCSLGLTPSEGVTARGWLDEKL